MELIRCKATARAGLVGNPSDGYQGKTIAVGVPEYFAQVVMYEWEDLELIPSQEDQKPASRAEGSLSYSPILDTLAR